MSRDSGSRVQTLLAHLESPLTTLLDAPDLKSGYDRENDEKSMPAVAQLRIVTDSTDWDKRTEIGIVDSKTNRGVKVRVDPNRNRAFVPNGYLEKLFENASAATVAVLLSHLQFLMKKDGLGQDSFLLGPPGSRKRQIAMAFCELAGREVEFLSISQDTTVADIKQRREIKAGTAKFEDSCAVRAAVHGRVLILEGVEKAERNVLSTLNNLLENREMSLEDGRFLTNPVRFDEIMKEHGRDHLEKRWKDDDVRLVRVSDRFRVVCLGIPVPEFEGNPLDPPFRSRFQSRDVNEESRTTIAESRLVEKIRRAKQSLDAASVLSLDGVPSRALKRNGIPAEFDRFVADLVRIFPHVLGRFAVACVYPTPHLPTTDPTQRHLMMEALERHGLLDDEREAKYVEPIPAKVDIEDRGFSAELAASTPRTEYRDRVLGPRFTSRFGYRLESIKNISPTELECVYIHTGDRKQESARVTIRVPGTGNEAPERPSSDADRFVRGIEYHDELISQMIALYAVAQYSSSSGAGLFSLVGSRGSGKTCLLNRFASLLKLTVVSFPLHRDMTSQDLFMRRATLANGDTVWNSSPLLTACERGYLLVLDSVEAMAPATLGTLSSLLTDREASLPDGTRIVRNAASKSLPTDRVAHANFRVVAIGRPAASDASGKARSSWLTSEVLSCFMPFLWVRALSETEEKQIVESLLPASKSIEDVQRLLVFGQYLRTREDEESRSLSLSTRQLIRISKRICAVHREGRSELAGLIQHSCLWRFLPSLARGALEAAMSACGIHAAEDNYYTEDATLPPPKVSMLAQPVLGTNGRRVVGKLQIGEVECSIFESRDDHEKSLIPDTYFVENPRQTRILKGMLQDYLLGSHLLLLGNQGTGKNKLVDRLLHLLSLPREYIQLDRDTTVNALTSQPVVEDGVVRYEDSPLVKAARFGRILVVDEADKAPTHVTAILKSLLADGEMLLSDGRRLVRSPQARSSDDEDVIIVHQDFRAIVLANRPGYPFLGNDLFRETGDIFAPHVVDNPDEESELALLREYAPNVPEETLRKLTVAFQDLRGLVNDGKLLYPYSTRELVNAVKHMERFPRDGLAVTLQNVFDFDRYAIEDRKTITVLFERHGIPVSLHSRYQVKVGNVTPLPEPILTETWKPPAMLPSSSKVNFVIHSIAWKLAATVDAANGATIKTFNTFPITLSASKVPLVRHEGRATVFEEQLFSFSLPTAEFSGHGVGIVGACALNDFSFVTAANDAFNSLRLYWVKSPSALREFDVYDVNIPHFNFRDEFIPQVKRPAPSRCTLFPLPKEGTLGMYSHDDQSLFVVDLIQKQFRLSNVDPAVFRVSASNVPAGLYAERMRTLICTDLCAEFGMLVVYQQLSRMVLLFDLLGDVRISLVLPFEVELLDPTSPFSFLVRSAQDGKTFVLKATGSSSKSAPQQTSTSIVVAGSSVRTGLIYTAFTLIPVEQHRIGVTAEEGTSTLHGVYSFISPNPFSSRSVEPQLDSNPVEKRFLKSSGTVCQVLEGYSQVFLPDAPNVNHQEALLRSYLRTNLTKKTADAVSASSALYLRGTSQMASLTLKRKKVIQDTVGRLSLSSGYFGFDNTGELEVVDLVRNTLRVIKVSLPETSRRTGSAMLSERFDPDGVAVHDDQDEEEDLDGGPDKFLNHDESNPASRQRAPFVYVMQTLQGDVLTLDRTGVGRVFQVDQERLDKALESWKSMVGQNANDDDLDFEDGESGTDEEDDEDEDEDEDEGEDDDDDEDDDDEEDDDEDEVGDAEQDDAPHDGQPGGKGKARRGGKKGGKASGRAKRSGKKGGRASGRRRRGGPANQRGGGSSRRRGGGAGQPGQGGQGGPGGQGDGGGGGGDGMSLPEPGQFRGPRSLSPRDREIAQARLEELRRLTRYFPNDERIREEMENLEARIEEADEADRMNKDDQGDAELRKRIASLRSRLERIEQEIGRGQREGRNTTRLESEAQQIRQMINRLEQQLSGDGDGDGDGEGEGEGRGARGRKGQRGRGKRGEMDEQARKEAKKLEKEAWKETVQNLEANPQDVALYQRYKDSVASEIRELRATLDQMHAKKNERVWLRNKDVGDLDDRRLVDGLTGERNIYKRRGDRPPDPFAFQDHPKRLTFLFDVSSSMSRYSMDGRLERSLEAATMSMEAFKGYEHKFAWKFRGHSGSTADVTFVEPGKYPKDDAARLDVLRKMNAHAETCGSGDNTLEATKLAIREITKDEGDEYFCILFSDANIEQYSIRPSDLKALLELDERVNVFIVFIGSMGMQAQRLRAELPQDRVFVTLSTSQIPAVLKRIFLSSVLKE